MPTASVTSKGQITIPQAVREALRIDTGDRVAFVPIGPGRFEFIAATQPIARLKGMFGKPVKAVSVEEMNEAIAAAASSSAKTR